MVNMEYRVSQLLTMNRNWSSLRCIFLRVLHYPSSFPSLLQSPLPRWGFHGTEINEVWGMRIARAHVQTAWTLLERILWWKAHGAHTHLKWSIRRYTHLKEFKLLSLYFQKSLGGEIHPIALQKEHHEENTEEEQNFHSSSIKWRWNYFKLSEQTGNRGCL